MEKKRVPDPKILQSVSRRLASSGIRAPSTVTSTSMNGDVTLSGTLQYEHQRSSALQAVQGVEGVRRVIDHMTVKPTLKRT
jgi:osmotically-inducible protein OsmY